MRKGIRALVSVFTLSAVLLAVGCSTAWLSSLGGYLKIAGPVLIQILDIVSLARGVPVNQALVSKITADQAAVQSLADSVSAATGQNITGACQAFNIGVSTFANDLSAIEQLAQVSDPTKQAQIQSLTQLAQQTINEVEAPIAACQAAPTGALALARLQAGVVTLKGPEDVVKRFNALVDSKHQIHYHNRFVRFFTLGKLQ